MSVHIGKVIRELRERRGWTQADLAERWGTDQSTVGRKEAGKIRVSMKDLATLAEIFQMPLVELEALCTKTATGPGDGGVRVLNRAAAGRIIDYERAALADSTMTFEFLDRGSVTQEDAFALCIVDDSMTPRILKGDYVVFVPCDDPPEGAIVFVRFSQGPRPATVARWFSEGAHRIRLAKDNVSFRTETVDRQSIQSISIAIERRTRSF